MYDALRLRLSGDLAELFRLLLGTSDTLLADAVAVCVYVCVCPTVPHPCHLHTHTSAVNEATQSSETAAEHDRVVGD